MNDKYVLNEAGDPVPCADLMTWARWFEHADDARIVAKTEVNGVTVSTVFLGLNRRRGVGPPILWETLVIGGPLDGESLCYASRAHAEQGHVGMVRRVQAP